MIACSCAIPCSCGAIASILKHREQDCVIRFLKGLNENFTYPKSQIMMMTLLPDIDKAFSLIIQQEREMQSSMNALIPTGSSNEDTIAFQVQTNSVNSYGKPSFQNGKTHGYTGAWCQNRVCTHCRRTNHTVETYFLKHKARKKLQVLVTLLNPL